MIVDATYKILGLKNYSGRRHHLFESGRPQKPTVLVVHYSAGSKDTDALRRYMARSNKSYHIAIGREGESAQWVRLEDAAWHAGGGTWTDPELVCNAPLPVGDVKRVRRRLNLRSVGVCFCNLGRVSPGVALQLRNEGAHVTEGANHRNRCVRTTKWESYTDAQVLEFRRILPLIVAAAPTLRIVVGHDDVQNCYINGKGRAQGGSKTDPGPAFPWRRFDWAAHGLTRVIYDYDDHCWRALQPLEIHK